MKMRRWLVIIPLVMATISCNINIPITTEQINSVETSVSATLTALVPTLTALVPTLTAQVPTLTVTTTVTPGFILTTGFVQGSLSYPSDFIPPLRIVFWDVSSSAYQYLDTPVNQMGYLIELPVGTYYVVAYAMDQFGVPTGLAGGYTQAVLCGLQVGCTDSTLIPVTVVAGGTVLDISPGDWYADPAAFPPPPP
jgi:hypothetical protein